MKEQPIYLMPAKLAVQYLPAQQLIRIIHASSATVYGWCNVEDLPRTLGGNNINEFWVMPVDSD